MHFYSVTACKKIHRSHGIPNHPSQIMLVLGDPAFQKTTSLPLEPSFSAGSHRCTGILHYNAGCWGTHQTISKTATKTQPELRPFFVSSPMISGRNNLCMFRLLNEVAVCWFQVSGTAKWLQNHSHFLSTHIIHQYRRLTILSGVLPTQTQHLRKKNSPFDPAQPRLLGKRTFLKTWRHCKGLLEPLLLITNIPEKPTKYNPTVNERFDKYV